MSSTENRAGHDDRAARLAQCRQYLELDPGNVHLMSEAIDCATALGEYVEARRLIAEANEAHPEDRGFRFQLATLALAEGNYEEARVALQWLLDQGETHPAIRFNFAVASQQLRNFEAVREVLSTYSEADWRNVPHAVPVFCRSLHHLSDFSPAIERLESHLALWSDDHDAWGLLALLKYDADDLEGAQVAGERALALAPDNGEAMLALGSISLDRQDPDQSMRLMDRAVSLYPTHGRAWAGRAFVHMLNLDLEHASDDFDEALQRMPNHVGTWHGKAWLQILMDDFPGARLSMQRAMELDRNFSETHGTLALIEVLAGNSEAARHHLQRSLRIDRESFAGRLAQAILLAQGGRTKLTSAMMEQMAKAASFESGRSLQQMVLEVLSRKQRAMAKQAEKDLTDDA